MAQERLPERLEEYRPGSVTYRNTGLRVLFGIDSDGCVDKGMRSKHGGPFPRAGIECFGLAPIAEAWRIAWAYVNEIEDRGCPRFKALAQVVDRALEMPVVQEAEKNGVVRVPRLEHLKAYLENVAAEKGYGDNVLADYLSALEDGPEKAELAQVAEWSRLVNAYVSSDCPYIPPFPNAIAAIKRAKAEGIDCMIVSGTPEEHLRETWEQHGLTGAIRGVFGRESGKKDVQLVGAVRAAERILGQGYDIVIMFGDAPGDDRARKKAAETAGRPVRFMPIRVGHEQEDWAWFSQTYLEPGRVQDYDEAAESARLEAFYRNLDRAWNPSADVTMLFQ